MPKIGFIVPVYKVREEYLRKCIDSLLKQTFKDIEIVLVDDCSPDECGNICEVIAQKDKRIKVFHHSMNKGLPEARNTGIENSKADWLTFIDADDWVELDMAESLSQRIDSQYADIYVYSGYRDYKRKVVECAYLYPNGTLFSNAEQLTGFEKRYLYDQTKIHIGDSFPIQSACIRLVSRKLFDKGLRFIDVKFSEDALFHLCSTEMANSVMYLQNRFYHYRDTENSMVNSYRENADKEQTSVIEYMWKFAKDNEKDEEFRRGIYLIAFSSLQMCMWQKYFNKSNKKRYSIRKKEFERLMKTRVFEGTLQNIPLSQLRMNQMIKFFLMKMKLYSMMIKLRDINRMRL